jgi:OOP family OmpA-OmpF porin
MKKIIAVLFTGVAAFGVHAEPSKIYWGGEVGISHLDDQTGIVSSGLVSEVGGSASASQDKNVTSFKVFGGYRYTENLDLEVGYFQSSTAHMNFNGVSSGSVAYTGNVNLKFSGFEYAANLRPNVSSGWNDLYFRIGGHSSKLDADMSIAANAVSASANKSYSGTGTLYGIGYDQKFNETTKIRYAAVKYSKVGGESDSGGTVYSIGLVKSFE